MTTRYRDDEDNEYDNNNNNINTPHQTMVGQNDIDDCNIITRNNDTSTFGTSRDTSSSIYELLQIDCLEYLCHKALFDNVLLDNNSTDSDDAVTAATVPVFTKRTNHNSIQLNNNLQNDIEQCVKNLYKQWMMKINKPVTMSPQNIDNVYFQIRQYNDKLYKRIQLTALYFDVFLLSGDTNTNSSKVKNICNENKTVSIPSSTTFRLFYKQFTHVYDLFTSTSTLTNTSNESVSSSINDAWTITYVAKIRQLLLVIYTLLRLQEQLGPLVVVVSTSRNELQNINTNNDIDITVLEAAIDEYNYRLRLIFSNNNCTTGSSLPTIDEIILGTKKSMSDDPRGPSGNSNNESRRKIVTNIDNGQSINDNEMNEPEEDDDDDYDDDDEFQTNTVNKKTRKLGTSIITNKGPIPRCLVSFLLNDLYHAGRRQSTTTTTSKDDDTTTTTTSTTKKTYQQQHHPTSINDLAKQILHHINTILVIDDDSSQTTISDGDNYSIARLQGMVRTLIRHWGMTKLQRPNLVVLGYGGNSSSSSSTTTKIQSTVEDVVVVENNDNTTQSNARINDTIVQVTDAIDASQLTTASSDTYTSVDLLMSQKPLATSHTSKVAGDNSRPKPLPNNLTERAVSNAVRVTKPSDRFGTQRLTSNETNSIARDYALLLAREMALEEDVSIEEHVVPPITEQQRYFDKENNNSQAPALPFNVKELLRFSSSVRQRTVAQSPLENLAVSTNSTQSTRSSSTSRTSPKRSRWTTEAKQRHEDSLNRRSTIDDGVGREVKKRKQLVDHVTNVQRRPTTQHEDLDFHSDDEQIDYSRNQPSIFDGSDEDHQIRANAILQGLDRFRSQTNKWEKIRKSSTALENFLVYEIQNYYRERVVRSQQLQVDNSDDNNNDDDMLFIDDVHSNRKQPKRRRPFSDDEIQGILDGIEKFGAGRWSDIQKNDPRLVKRTSVQIKDKYRTMVQKGEIQ